MSTLWHEIFAFVSQHSAWFEATGGVLVVALITCLPEKRPRSLDDFYTYIRESLQTAIPAGRRIAAANPTTPEAPAQPKP